MKLASEFRKIAEAAIANYDQEFLNELEIEIDTRAEEGHFHVDTTRKIDDCVRVKLEHLGYTVDASKNTYDVVGIIVTTRISW